MSRRLLYTVGMSDTTKSIRLDMRISRGDKDLFQRAAEKDGRTVSDWIRHRLIRTARQELGEGTAASTSTTAPTRKRAAEGRGKRLPSP
jgi:uncharacterized protein (DUF1778 family)